MSATPAPVSAIDASQQQLQATFALLLWLFYPNDSLKYNTGNFAITMPTRPVSGPTLPSLAAAIDSVSPAGDADPIRTVLTKITTQSTKNVFPVTPMAGNPAVATIPYSSVLQAMADFRAEVLSGYGFYHPGDPTCTLAEILKIISA